ncbi:hypothetical protein GTA08_BOTSDO14011 [Botryosphaeria dothidea]|uniref:Uncharacterized protein n=1 Tax=Botryosphaeria dothidea TaxID=55169 RepID=A0A8H4N478_9PEZI|nr:hypothetical protein GTA08_BOTSDO14011 [Botryosphaeria dothidea]
MVDYARQALDIHQALSPGQDPGEKCREYCSVIQDTVVDRFIENIQDESIRGMLCAFKTIKNGEASFGKGDVLQCQNYHTPITEGVNKDIGNEKKKKKKKKIKKRRIKKKIKKKRIKKNKETKKDSIAVENYEWPRRPPQSSSSRRSAQAAAKASRSRAVPLPPGSISSRKLFVRYRSASPAEP